MNRTNTEMTTVDRINKRQGDLLNKVLSGQDSHYRTEYGHIRWGRVQTDMQAIVLQEISDEPESEEG